ncbi:hypothetical protein WT83_28955 [Burkholderia territorii]|uniref:Transposase n=1 Tax=Burkholderia territorii TaxID=1503055 RepID=A0A119VDJ2_9BURK|nr:hypothetical protein WT83_28955 [Burkholderia territorii]
MIATITRWRSRVFLSIPRKLKISFNLQDTTEVDFNGRGTAGHVSASDLRDDPERLPLGGLDAWMWARDPKGKQGKRDGVKRACAVKGYERITETATSLPQTRLVYVADREADMIALMVRAQQLDTPVDWPIRSPHDRALPEGARLWSAASEGKPIGEIAFTMGSRHGAKAREVRQHV